jgi:hypothetical protein
MLLLLLPAGCSGGGPGEIQASLDSEFMLSIGQSGRIASEDLAIEFIEVIGDSRCPEGAVCIWEGEVTCLIEIDYAGMVLQKTLVQRGSPGFSTTDFSDYRIEFNVQPYPQVGEQIEESEYRLLVTVSRKPALSGGILATFDVLGERYSVFITNGQTIEAVLALQRGESEAKIPSGRILRGSVPYNEPWSWNIDSEDIHMAEVTIELCDGRPSMVEVDLDYWVDTVQRFCPWQAELVSVEDYR